jgi:hypothetical protein
MTEFAGSWVRAIAGAALICAVAFALTPKGKVKSVLKLVCGIVLICAIVNPVIKKNLPDMSMDMSKYRDEADEITNNAKDTKNSLSRTIIEDKLKAYILDKAKSYNAQLDSVSVSVKWGDEECWYPYEVSLTANIGEKEKGLISNAIEAELGIPKERQYWSGDEK